MFKKIKKYLQFYFLALHFFIKKCTWDKVYDCDLFMLGKNMSVKQIALILNCRSPPFQIVVFQILPPLLCPGHTPYIHDRLEAIGSHAFNTPNNLYSATSRLSLK